MAGCSISERQPHLRLELAAEYLLMAAMLIEIKSRMLVPSNKTQEGEEADDPRAAGEISRLLGLGDRRLNEDVN